LRGLSGDRTVGEQVEVRILAQLRGLARRKPGRNADDDGKIFVHPAAHAAHRLCSGYSAMSFDDIVGTRSRRAAIATHQSHGSIHQQASRYQAFVGVHSRRTSRIASARTITAACSKPR
jgi:hypothetical protein